MVMWRRYNSNPCHKRVGDCTVRALTVLLDEDWHTVYRWLCDEGDIQCDMPSSNAVWGSFLYQKGYVKYLIRSTPDHIVTVDEFASDHPTGKYLLATGTHVVAVVNGDYYDSWDSGDEVPVYFWQRG